MANERTGRATPGALVARDTAGVAALLSDDAALLIAGWRGSEAYRPRDRVLARLQAEWDGWLDPRLEIFTVLGDATRVAVEFGIQVTEQDRYVEHNRSAFLTVAGDRVTLIDLYCPEPMPSAHRKGWIAPATLSDAAIRRALVEMRSRFDLREWMPPLLNSQFSLRGGRGGSGDAHPGSNGAGGAHWTEEAARPHRGDDRLSSRPGHRLYLVCGGRQHPCGSGRTPGAAWTGARGRSGHHGPRGAR